METKTRRLGTRKHPGPTIRANAYSITPSARASSVGGIWRPSALDESTDAPRPLGLLRWRDHRPSHRRATQRTEKFSPPHDPAQGSGECIVSAQMRPLVGAETGLVTAIFSAGRCRSWVFSPLSADAAPTRASAVLETRSKFEVMVHV